MEILFALIPALICFMILVYFIVVIAKGSFDTAFEIMTRKRQRAVGTPAEGEKTPLLEEGKGTAGTVAEGDDLSWSEITLIVCMVVMILTHAMSAGFAPLTQVVVSLAYAHRLMLVRFTAEFVGRLCAHFQFVELGARAMMSITIVRVVLLLALVVESFNLDSLKTSE